MRTCLEKRKSKKIIETTTEIFIKEEIKISPPYPHKEKILNIFPIRRIHIFSSLQNDNVVNVFILNKENMTDLHVYTHINTYTNIIHTHTQISYRKKKNINVVMMNHGDVDRRTNRW
jgi:hypothetical protein